LSKDTWLGWYSDRKVEEGVAAFSRFIREQGARTVLDFGCGTGRHTVYLAELGFHVFGFDWSEASVAVTRKELDRRGLGADLAVWDMNNTPLPYPDSCFDAVIAVRVLQHAFVEAIRKSAREIGRITRKGGRLYVEVPTYERVTKQKQEGITFKEYEDGTLVPLAGDEVGIPHHFFRKEDLAPLFGMFSTDAVTEAPQHLCLTATRI
jgi:SAM-dependent methyltransferase